ncbi:MAG TPA: lysozyme [Hymenobacter sp.]|jgi:lysozyme
MKTGSQGLALIKKKEKFKPRAYLCPARKWTIGYGHVILASEQHLRTAVLTEPQASELLACDVVGFEKAVLRTIHVPLSQAQFDACMSLCYNIGPGSEREGTGFAGSSVARAINARTSEATIRLNWYKFNKADGTHDGKDNDGDGQVDEAGEKRVLPGLVVRRQKEADLYFSK